MLPLWSLALLQILLLSQKSEAFLGSFFRAGQAGCSCPCRTNTVRRCIESHENTHYHHHHRQLTARNVTETECQVCRHIHETKMVDSFKW